ncbi:MAG: sigma-70 family RNA polymerase sigma factor [Thermoleophilia bacterium]|nr:sigma-70 family RNA polymerase sigma factor [Thermoleophilia bacterium]
MIANKTQRGCEAETSDGGLVKISRALETESRNAGLVARYQRSGEKHLLEKILDRNQGLLHAVLRRFSFFPDPYEDLLQVANLGLIKAVQRFDVSRGVEFSSYATALIDGEVRHYLRDNVLMRRPRWLRKAEKRIENASVELTRNLRRRPTIAELAKKVNISEEGVLEILRASAGTGMLYIDEPRIRDNQDSVDNGNIHSLRYESFSLPIEDRIALRQAIDALSAFEKKLVYFLFYWDMTQSEVAEKMGLNQRKVSRESAKTLARLREVLNAKIF